MNDAASRQRRAPPFPALLVYLPLLMVLFAYSRGYSSVGPALRRLFRGDGRTDLALWEKLIPTIPLVVGAGVAWSAGVLWSASIREASGVDSGVSPEFFAQLSQVIPVLLLALLFQSRALRPRTPGSARSALSLYVVLVLVAGEALVLSVLPVSNQADMGNGIVLADPHEYIAFVLGVYGTVVALTTLVVLQAGGLEEETESMAVTVVE